MLDSFTLLIDNTSIPVSSYTVHYDLFDGCGTFTADVDHTKIIDLTQSQIPFEIRIDGVSMMKGFTEKIVRSYDKNSISQTVSGRDMMQVLVDNYIMQPQAYPGKPQKSNDLSSLFGTAYTDTHKAIPIDPLIRNVWESSKQISSIAIPGQHVSNGQLVKGKAINPPLSLPSINFPIYASNALDSSGEMIALFQVKKIRTGHGQSLFEFFSHLLNGLGMYMYNIPGTSDIIIHQIQNGEQHRIISYDRDCTLSYHLDWYKITNLPGDPGNNVISCQFTQDISDYYKFFRIVGQCEDEDGLYSGGSSAPNYLIADKIEHDAVQSGYRGVTKMRANSLNVLNANVWYNEQTRLLANELMQQNKQLNGLQYTLSGHSPDGRNPYFFNHVAFVNDSILRIYEQDMLVYGVEFKGSKTEGQTTTLSLYNPHEIPNLISNPDIW